MKTKNIGILVFFQLKEAIPDDSKFIREVLCMRLGNAILSTDYNGRPLIEATDSGNFGMIPASELVDRKIEIQKKRNIA